MTSKIRPTGASDRAAWKSGISSRLSRAKNGQPCLCCGAQTKGCSLTSDRLALCRGQAGPGWIHVKNCENGFHAYRHENTSREKYTPHMPKSLVGKWEARVRKYEGGFTPNNQQQLSHSLKLPIEALQNLRIGFSSEYDGSYTFPECNGNGTIIGFGVRTQSGSKLTVPGSKRGLTLPDAWDRHPGPLFVPEGPSDVLALSHAGIACIGRPSNCGGFEHLLTFFLRLEAERQIIIVGENDQKPNGTWPGRDGAILLAQKLSQGLVRPVYWALPPEKAKDCRDWLIGQEGNDWHAKGKALTHHLLQNTTRLDGSRSIGEVHGAHDVHVSGRPEIVIGTDEHRVNDEAIAALAQDNSIYQRGELLVRVIESGISDSRVTLRNTPQQAIRDIPQAILREAMTKCALWKRKDSRTGQYVPSHPPAWSVSAVTSRLSWPGIRHLKAVVNHPVFLHDGSILSQNGYDPRSNLIVAIPKDLHIHVPQSPTQAEIQSAVTYLLEVVCDFPFETDAHRSSWIASLMTPLAWFSFDGSAPLFLIDGNTPGVGKGLLADVAGLALTGARFPVMSYSHDAEEMRKKITTLALEGERLVLFDNLIGPFGNSVLDAALTTTRWKDRLLNENRSFNGELDLVWYATGNNVQLMGDTPRRILQIRLETQHECPEIRTDFKQADLRQYVLHNRGKILSAALLILRAWHEAGRPKKKIATWGSFQNWSDCIRQALVFAGLVDPLEARQAFINSSDTVSDGMASLLQVLEEMDVSRRGFTSADIAEQVDTETRTLTQNKLRHSLLELCKPEPSKIGALFRKYQKRNFGGRRLVKDERQRGINRWTVTGVTQLPTIQNHVHHVPHVPLEHLHEI